jgi:hypothetical protein
MSPQKLRKATYALVAVQGLVTAVAPRLASRFGRRMGLLGFDNSQVLEAEDWYVRAVRATGIGMLAAGGTALLLEDRTRNAERDAEPDQPAETEDASEPIEVEI